MDLLAGDYSSIMTGTLSTQSVKQDSKTESLKNKITNSSTDEEMMEACKSFESYFVEQMIQSMRDTIPKDEEENSEYEDCFGDMLYQEYANSITESGQLGIAQKLYEAMKRNSETL